MKNLNKKSINQLKSVEFTNISKIFGGADTNWYADSKDDKGVKIDSCYMTADPRPGVDPNKDTRTDGTESCKDVEVKKAP